VAIVLSGESQSVSSSSNLSEVEEVRMVLEDQPLVSEAVATLLAEVVVQTQSKESDMQTESEEVSEDTVCLNEGCTGYLSG
jgi:hypothetical protein